MSQGYIIAGAGLAGITLAERIASVLDRPVVILEKRAVPGGNIRDDVNSDGILVHSYGPHVFHTNDREVYEYLSRFTDWRPYHHRVLAWVDGKYVPLPITLETLNRLYNRDFTPQEAEALIASRRVPLEQIRTSRDVALAAVGEELYEKIFRSYTRKQWGVDASELDASVISRIPIRYNHDTRYFTDTYQGVPRDGYTRMCERMLKHPNITLRCGVDFNTVRQEYAGCTVIYTGPVDSYFDCCFGPLPYRSLRFSFETLPEASYQPEAVVNFPNDYAFTRITECKKLTGQQHPRTTIVREYPSDSGEPFYPFPTESCRELYERYRALEAQEKNVYFLGRLAEYRYYNMDETVRSALDLFERIKREARA